LETFTEFQREIKRIMSFNLFIRDDFFEHNHG